MENLKDLFDDHWKKIALISGALAIGFVGFRVYSNLNSSQPLPEPNPLPAGQNDPSRENPIAKVPLVGNFFTEGEVSNAAPVDPATNQFKSLPRQDGCVEVVETRFPDGGVTTNMNTKDPDYVKLTRIAPTTFTVSGNQNEPGVKLWCQ